MFANNILNGGKAMTHELNLIDKFCFENKHHGTPIVIITHGGCTDGNTARYVLHEYISKYAEVKANMANVHTIDGVHGQHYDSILCANANIIIADFCFKPNVMERLCSIAKHVLVLDHHISAANAMADIELPNLTKVFEMKMSGTLLAWAYCNKTSDSTLLETASRAPTIVDYVSDGDLYNFNLDYSREINAVIHCSDQSIDGMCELARKVDVKGTDWMVEKGKTILENTSYHANRCVESASTGKIGGITVKIANCPNHLASETCHRLLTQGNLIGASYEIVTNKLQNNTPYARFSLRSLEDGPNVSEIAKKYGGGGHVHAAGFELPLNDLFKVLTNV